LTQKDKRERKVDYHTTTDYADGTYEIVHALSLALDKNEGRAVN
jgi:hypothetical protein